MEREDEKGEKHEERIFLARGSSVFNLAQVDGYELPKIEPVETTFDRFETVDRFITKTGAKVRTGSRACYVPSLDQIEMPAAETFIPTKHSTAEEGYYSTHLHELVHWTGAKTRLDRDFSGRFGSQAYAAEELVAELGAAFLCGELGITATPRQDHAQYLASWLKVLKGDKRAIFTAASKASAAADFLKGTAEGEGE